MLNNKLKPKTGQNPAIFREHPGNCPKKSPENRDKLIKALRDLRDLRDLKDFTGHVIG